MPIERDSEDWKNGREPQMIEARVVDFLSTHSDKAFTLRELANEMEVADWAGAKQWTVDSYELDHDELKEKYSSDHPTPRTEINPTCRFLIILRQLSQRGIIEIREVDAVAFDDSYILPNEDKVEITTIAYSAD